MNNLDVKESFASMHSNCEAQIFNLSHSHFFPVFGEGSDWGILSFLMLTA